MKDWNLGGIKVGKKTGSLLNRNFRKSRGSWPTLIGLGCPLLSPASGSAATCEIFIF
jgi:hypothetical protein